MVTTFESADKSTTYERRLPVGAEVMPQEGVHFRVWAPKRRSVAVVLPGAAGRETELHSEGNGYFSGALPFAAAGDCYQFRLDEQDRLFPDPASRFQPQGPDGPSQIIDPRKFRWSDAEWKGIARDAHVIYEMHVGTFTPEGTWKAACDQLSHLAELGITTLELMPVADFFGRFGWGYDGVNWYAPTRLYGEPDDFRHFVDCAHRHGLAVILDVVYNHLGPRGCHLREFSDDYFSRRCVTEWGDALNFDGEQSEPVREYVVANAGYWIDEFHLDGLRLDATQQIFDTSPEHVLLHISRRVRQMAGTRPTLLVAENEPQDARLVRAARQGGYELDALWNDDFHHSAMVALTGHNEAYYTDHLGTAQEFISAAKYGYLYQGQWYRWQQKRRGTFTRGIPPSAFVNFIQNHDQVANSARGLRCQALTSPGRFRAMSALMLLMPGTPMLFQGQEFASSRPFLFFADQGAELEDVIAQGRAEFLKQFPNIAQPEMQTRLPRPSDEETFTRCKLDFSERQTHGDTLALHRDLLRLRRNEPALRVTEARQIDGAVLSDGAFVLRFFHPDDDDRLLIINFGRSLHLNPAPEPLLAPPPGQRWAVLWSSEDPQYGGCGLVPPETEENWRISGEAAILLRPEPEVEDKP